MTFAPIFAVAFRLLLCLAELSLVLLIVVPTKAKYPKIKEGRAETLIDVCFDFC